MTIDTLDAVCAPLDEKLRALVSALKGAVPSPISSGYFNGHYRKTQNGAFEKELYPIPVVTVQGLCDVELEPNGVSVTTNCALQTVLSYRGSVLLETPFDAYGVEDFLSDYGNDLSSLKAFLTQSADSECFLIFSFPAAVSVAELLRFVIRLKAEQFYY